MAFTAAEAKALCTAVELTLVKASLRNEIGKFSVVQIRQKVDRTRKLRDKWRDQAKKQRRATQTSQRSRETGANARSAEKSELFGEVLARFEVQLASLEAKGQASRPAPKRLPTRARSAKHRAERADIRAELKEERLALAGRKKPKVAKVTKKKPVDAAALPLEVKPDAAAPQTASKRAPKPTIPAAKAGRGKRAHAGTGMTALESARELQGLRVTKGKQLRAGAAAKKSRLQASGLMRVQNNASARNRRSQGKRDAR